MATIENNLTENDILQRHKRELNELQAKITDMKHSASKGDKKRKREVAAEIAKLQAELDQRHESELSENKSSNSISLEDELNSKMTMKNGATNNQNKVSKAQKRRDKKEEQKRERDRLIAEQEEANLEGVRHLEAEKLKTVLATKGLQLYEIPSDGDCLYGAIAHQLLQHAIEMTVTDLRHKTADFIRKNKDEFLPFLYDKDDSGLPFTEDKFEEYCSEIESTAAWGGHLELRAISSVLKRPIEVLQAEGQPLLLGDEHKNDQLTITYHRHAYGLGEHYNSSMAASEPKQDEDFS